MTALLVATSVLSLASGALAQTDFGAAPERYLRLEWEVAERSGRPVVRGRVFNDYGFAARDIRLVVEGLDAAGHVRTRTVGYVPFLVTPGTTGPFVVRLPEKAAQYRVSVVDFRWVLPDDERIFRRW
jgi:hypothetical protein